MGLIYKKLVILMVVFCVYVPFSFRSLSNTLKHLLGWILIPSKMCVGVTIMTQISQSHREEIYIFPLLMIMNCKMENTRHHLQNFTTSTHIHKTWYITKSWKAFCNNYMSTRASCTHYHLLGFIIYLLFEIANFYSPHTLCVGWLKAIQFTQILMVNHQNFLMRSTCV